MEGRAGSSMSKKKNNPLSDVTTNRSRFHARMVSMSLSRTPLKIYKFQHSLRPYTGPHSCETSGFFPKATGVAAHHPHPGNKDIHPLHLTTPRCGHSKRHGLVGKNH